jgi:hypothetical protein
MSDEKVRVLVTGGRTYRDQEAVWRALDALSPDFVIQGGAEGADAAARSWASARGVASATFHAHWSHGRGAGPRRNSWMLMYGDPTVVLKCPGGAGTEDLRRQATRRGIPVQTVDR